VLERQIEALPEATRKAFRAYLESQGGAAETKSETRTETKG
jgi:hypothetical protein